MPLESNPTNEHSGNQTKKHSSGSVTLNLDAEIVCPYDSTHKFPLEDGLSSASIQALQQTSVKREQELRDSISASLNKEAEERIKAAEIRFKEAEIAHQVEIKRRIDEERKSLDEKRRSLEQLLEERSKSVAERELAEMKLRDQLRDAQNRVNVEVARAIAEQKQVMAEEAEVRVRQSIEADVQKEREQTRLKVLELEKQRADAQRVAEELRRKMAQSSQQGQGEVLELDLEGMLSQLFPTDTVSEVPKGVSGADILLEVRSTDGTRAGTLSIEAKNTKTFSSSWVQKAKQDQIAAGAEIAIIITQSMPQDIAQFGEIDGVWICSISCWKSVLSALRGQLVALHRTRLANVSKDSKLELLYRYLTGSEFKARIEFMVSRISEMQDQLCQERRAFTKHWSRREKLLLSVSENVTAVYGDLQGVIGTQSLEEIPALSLEAEDSED